MHQHTPDGNDFCELWYLLNNNGAVLCFLVRPSNLVRLGYSGILLTIGMYVFRVYYNKLYFLFAELVSCIYKALAVYINAYSFSIISPLKSVDIVIGKSLC